jgi:two-component sensor histidine kinase
MGVSGKMAKVSSKASQVNPTHILRRIWAWLVFSRFGTDDPDVRFQAYFASIGLLVAMVNIILGALLAPGAEREYLGWIAPFMVLAYILGRTRFYRIGSGIALAGAFSLIILIMPRIGADDPGIIVSLSFFTATIFIVSFWMGFKWLVLLAAAQTAVVLTLLGSAPAARQIVLGQWLPLNLFFVALILLARRLQDLNVRRLLQYQEHLEELVALRSRDLQEANRNLELKFEQERDLTRNLEQVVTQKDVLLKELVHRTKNNMQVISSLLQIQSVYAAGTAAEKQIAAARDRVQTITLVHEKLLRSRDLALIDLKEYLRDLAGERIRVYMGESGRIRLTLDGEPVFISLDRAVPLGLAVNELLTNILKYAFPRDRSGRIGILIAKQADGVELEIRDDGVGFPEGFDPRAASGLGFSLVYQIVEGQLNGFFQTTSENGVRSIIRFRI